MRRISEKLEGMINLQIAREEESSRLYRAMGEYLKFKGWFGGAELYSKYAKEEMTHMEKFYNYLQDRDVKPATPLLKAPPQEFKDVEEIVKLTYEHEMQVSKWLSEIAIAALTEKDMTTYEFMQWFILEQIEEEVKALDLLNIIEIMKSTNTPMYFLDMEFKKRV